MCSCLWMIFFLHDGISIRFTLAKLLVFFLVCRLQTFQSNPFQCKWFFCKNLIFSIILTVTMQCHDAKWNYFYQNRENWIYLVLASDFRFLRFILIFMFNVHTPIIIIHNILMPEIRKKMCSYSSLPHWICKIRRDKKNNVFYSQIIHQI